MIQRSSMLARVKWPAVLVLLLLVHSPAIGQDESQGEEDARAVQLAERFLGVLEKNPRRGTALDRIYGHHVEFGTLDAFVEGFKKKAEEKNDGASWMILGLLASQRGNDAEAVEAYQRAESLRPTDAMVPFYRSQSLLRIGEMDEGVEALERAIAAKPPRADLMEIYQQLGRVLQRAQRTEDALAVWKRFEAEFPNDPRVLEQIATISNEENALDAALQRYQRLVEIVTDDYKRALYRIAAAELKVKLKQRDAGIADFESVLNDLNPTSWMHRDVRRRIDDVFLRSGDQDGLVGYYEAWLAKNPEDVEGMARLAKFLSASARVPEATTWMEKALKLAPTRSDLRKAFIDQLVEQQRYTDADKQYELLAASDSNASNLSDTLRDWGKLIQRNREIPEETRNARLLTIWNRILDGQEKDPLVHAQVADLFRNANISPRAIDLYQKAIELAPTEPQYREYLGEYYHILKDEAKALATWEGIAAPPRRNADTLARVAEVYQNFGFSEKAVAEIVEACKLAPKDFSLQLQAADYLCRASRESDAIPYLDQADLLAENEDQKQTALAKRIEAYQQNQTLDEESEKLRAKVEQSPNAYDFYLLARYQEGARMLPEAIASIEKSLAIEPTSILSLTTHARLLEANGDPGKAADVWRSLVQIDRRSRDEHWMKIAQLEMELGRIEQALDAGNQLIMASPSNTTNYEFLAQLCFRLGKEEEGIAALRRAMRIAPNEPSLLMALANALTNKLETREAIEIYWRAFDASEEIDDKTSLVLKLVPLYEQLGQFDILIDRFQREKQEEDKRRAMTICLAQAFQASGDLVSAKQELESLLSEDSKDTNLLQQLAKLSQSNGDIDQAIAYQRQLVSVAPGNETEFPLATMLQSAGYGDEANEIIVRLSRNEEDPVRLVRNLDSLLTQSNGQAVIDIIAPLINQQRNNWELLYREGAAWKSLDKPEEALNRFRRILELNLPHEAPSEAMAQQAKQAAQKAKSANAQGLQVQPLPRPPGLGELTMMAGQVRMTTGLEIQDYYYAGQQRQSWSPRYYGEARMASLAWITQIERAKKAKESEEPKESEKKEETDSASSFESEVIAAAKSTGATQAQRYDGIYLANVLGLNEETFAIAKGFATSGTDQEKLYFLTRVPQRMSMEAMRNVRSAQGTPQQTPLNDQEIDLMLECFEHLASRSPEKDQQSTPGGGNIIYAGDGTAYIQVGNSYFPLQNIAPTAMLPMLIRELKLAGREEKANELTNQLVDSAKSTTQLTSLLNMYVTGNELDKVPELLPRWYAAAKEEIREGAKKVGVQSRSPTSGIRFPVMMATHAITNWMGHLAKEEENKEVLDTLEACLDIASEEYLVQQEALAANKRSSLTPAIAGSRRGSQWYYGKEQQYASFTIPLSGTLQSESAIQLLVQAHYSLERNGEADSLIALLTKLCEGTEGAKKVFRYICLSNALTIRGETEEASEALLSAIEELKGDPDYGYPLAELHVARNEFDEARTLLESLRPKDPAGQKRKELLLLDVSQRTGDIERATQAATRLFGMRLSSQEQLQLVEPLRRLGKGAMADAILARAERSAGNQISSLSSLMQLHAGQGKTESAKQIAMNILQRTNSPLADLATTQSNIRSVNMGRNSQNDAQFREQAFQVLQRTGELKPMLEKLEEQYKRTPDASRQFAQLVEYLDKAGQKDKSLAYVAAYVEKNPKVLGWRAYYAERLQNSNKAKEACDHYLEIIKQKPSFFANDFYQVQNVFAQANRMEDLVKVISESDLRSFGRSYMVVNIIENILVRDQNSAVALKLLERAIETFPDEAGSLLRSMNSPNIWANDNAFRFLKKGIIPSKTIALARPWYGLDQIDSYSSNGIVNNQFISMLRSLKNSSRIAELKKDIEERLKEVPTWKSGRFMIALQDLNSGKAEAFRREIESFLTPEEIKEMPPETAWILGGRIADVQELRPIAIQLLEHARGASRSVSGLDYTYLPDARLVTLYIAEGQKEPAREILLKSLTSKVSDQYDRSYANYRYMENAVSVVAKLAELEFGAEAIRGTLEVLQQESRLEGSSQYSGRPASYYISRLETTLQNSIALLKSSDAENVAAILLPDANSSRKRGDPLIDFAINVKKRTDEKVGNALESRFLEVLQKVAYEKKLREALEARIGALVERYPDDLSVLLLRAWQQTKTKSDALAETLNQISTFLESHPLDSIEAGKRPNMRQRKDAAKHIPLWLIAKELLYQEQHGKTAIQLAKRALDGANLQLENDFSGAIVEEWIAIAFQHQDREAGKALMEEGITRFKNRPNGEAPLTVSQFQSLLHIAKLAAQNQLSEVSKQAFAEAFRGGEPVADIPAGNATSSGLPTIASSGAVVLMAPGQTQSTLTFSPEAVGPWVLDVVREWSSTDYPPSDTYELLLPLVLPQKLPDVVRLYPVELTANSTPESLGLRLVIAAVAAGKSEALEKLLTERDKNNPTKPDSLILKAMLGVQSKNVPLAESALQALPASTVKWGLPHPNQALLHAALPAVDIPELETSAIETMRVYLRSISQPKTTDSDVEQSLDPIAKRINEYLTRSKSVEEVLAYYENWLEGNQKNYARYSDGYGLQFQGRDYVTVASELLKVGALNHAMDYFGRAVDLELPPRMGAISLEAPLMLSILQTRQLPEIEQYEIWKKWTLPATGRRTVRFGVCAHAPLDIPEWMRPQGVVYPPRTEDRYWSNFTELVQTAVACGKIEELVALVKEAEDEELLGASALRALVELERLQGDELDAHLATYFRGAYDYKHEDAKKTTLVRQAALVVYSHSMDKEAYFTRERQRFAEYFRYVRGQANTASADYVFDRYARWLAKNVDSSTPFNLDHGLRHWIATSLKPPANDMMNRWWYSHDGGVTHVSGGQSDVLLLNVPLTGDFTFEVENIGGVYGEGDLLFNGASVVRQQGGNSLAISSLSGTDMVRRPRVSAISPALPRPLRVRAKGDDIEFSFDGRVVYADKRSPSFPWLGLVAPPFGTTTFRNLRFTEPPVVTDEVPLFVDERLDGWVGGFPEVVLPRVRLLAEKPRENTETAYRQQQSQPPLHWSVANGELAGTLQPKLRIGSLAPTTELKESWMLYQRPLLEGESFGYEFYYEPGAFEVHPTFGNLALMLNADGKKSEKGVAFRWVTKDVNVQTLNGISRNPQVVAPKYQIASPSLKAKEWNRVELSLQQQTLTLRVNGADVLKFPTGDIADSRFGLFHVFGEEVRVRNGVLKGNWSSHAKELQGGDLLGLVRASSPRDAKVVDSLLPYQVKDAGGIDVVLESRTMEPNDAFDYLQSFVLPGERQADFRMAFGFATLDAQSQLDPTKVDSERFLSPPLEMVRLAKKLQKLPELKSRVEASADPYPANERARNALLALIAMEAGDLATAKTHIAQAQKRLATPLPKEAENGDRAPDLLVAVRAGQDPVLWPQGLDIARQLLTIDWSQGKTSTDPMWRNYLSTTVGSILRNKTGSNGTALVPKQWTNVAYRKAEHYADGRQPSTWWYRRGAVNHLTGETWGLLFFQSPLRGKYEITGKRTSYGYREAVAAIGTYAANPVHNLSGVKRSRIMHNAVDDKNPVSVPNWEKISEFRIVVDGQQVTSYANGLEIATETFDSPLDPWLVLQAGSTSNESTIFDLAIHGEPEIPSEIELLSSEGIYAWRGDFYSDWIAKSEDPNAPYSFAEGELTGRKRIDRSERGLESLVQYYRPMLEDGEIEFETYYSPGEFEIHPTLGRSILKLHPDGATWKQLPTPGSSQEVKIASNFQAKGKVPLRANDWNRVLLKLTGDELRVEVNGELAATLQIDEPKAERLFGLFRYSDETQARVRNVKYRGDWPKSLPKVEDQELAIPREGIYSTEGVASVEVIDFRKPLAELASAGVKIGGRPELFTTTEQGLKIDVVRASVYEKHPNFTIPIKDKGGDATYTWSFEKGTFGEVSGWGVGVKFLVRFDDDCKTDVDIMLKRGEKGKLHARTQISRQNAEPKQILSDDLVIPALLESGKVRFARVGDEFLCLYAEGNDSKFQIVHRLTLGGANPVSLSVRGVSSDEAATAQMVLKSLEIGKVE